MGASVGGITRIVTGVFTLGATELIPVNGSPIGEHLQRGVDTNDFINRAVAGVVTGGFSELERAGIGPTAPLKIGAEFFGQEPFVRTFEKTSTAITKVDTRRLSSSDALRLGGTAAGLIVGGQAIQAATEIAAGPTITTGVTASQVTPAGATVLGGTTQTLVGASTGIVREGLFAGIPILSALEQGAINTVTNIRDTFLEVIQSPERIIETILPGEPGTFDPGMFVLESAPIGTSPKQAQRKQSRSFLVIGLVIGGIFLIMFVVLRRRS